MGPCGTAPVSGVTVGRGAQGFDARVTLQTPRPPLQPSGNAQPSPRPQDSSRYALMPTPLFDSADTTPLPTARDSLDGGPLSARGEPLTLYGVPRSGRGEPLSARGYPVSSEISPRIPLPSPRQIGRYTRAHAAGSMAAVGSGSGQDAAEDPVLRSWRLAKEAADMARKRRVRQHAAVASPELLVWTKLATAGHRPCVVAPQTAAGTVRGDPGGCVLHGERVQADLEVSAETGASSDAVEQGLQHDGAAAPALPRVDSTDGTSVGTTCSTDSFGATTRSSTDRTDTRKYAAVRTRRRACRTTHRSEW